MEFDFIIYTQYNQILHAVKATFPKQNGFFFDNINIILSTIKCIHLWYEWWQNDKMQVKKISL